MRMPWSAGPLASFLLPCFLALTAILACKGKSSSEDDAQTRPADPLEIAAAKAFRCNQDGKVYDAKNDACAVAKDFCLEKQDGSIWQDDLCLTPEQQCLVEAGAQWRQGVCFSATQLCQEKNDGSSYINGKCLPPAEACAEKGFRYKWSQEQCLLKGFLDFCQETLAESEPSVQPTLRELRRQAAVAAGGVAGEASCADTYSWLKQQTSLRLVDLREQLLLQELSPLIEFKQLKRLELTNNRIKDLFALSLLPELEYLDLQNNRELSNLAPLATAVKLKSLFLGYNKIYDISVLSGLKGLQTLSLFENRISELKALQGLAELRVLHLKSNPLTSIAPLRYLDRLEDLNLELTPLLRKEVAATESNCPLLGKVSPLVRAVCSSLRP